MNRWREEGSGCIGGARERLDQRFLDQRLFTQDSLMWSCQCLLAISFFLCLQRRNYWVSGSFGCVQSVCVCLFRGGGTVGAVIVCGVSSVSDSRDEVRDDSKDDKTRKTQQHINNVNEPEPGLVCRWDIWMWCILLRRNSPGVGIYLYWEYSHSCGSPTVDVGGKKCK